MNLFPQALAYQKAAIWLLFSVLVLNQVLPGPLQAAALPTSAVNFDEPEEIPGPPLFNPDEIHTHPLHMSLAVLGSSSIPFTAPVGTTATLYAGEKVRSWSLEGPLTRWHDRVALSVATLAGQAALTGGLPGSTLATFQWGETLDCWVLRDTDRFRPMPRNWLREIEDGQGIGEGGFEADIYSRTLSLVQYTSPKALERAHSRGVTYTHIMQEPDRYRGEVLSIQGRLLRINRYDPPFEARQAGVHNLFEAWVFSEYLGANPYIVVFTNWPADLPRYLLGQPKIQGDVRVSSYAYFFKKFRYQSNDRSGSQRDAPLLVANTLQVVSLPSFSEERRFSWAHSLLYGFVAGFVLLLVCVLGLTFWYRRSDNQLRKRLLARIPEFHLPPADAAPLATPVGTTARSANPLNKSSRLPLTSGPRLHFPPAKEGGKPTPGGKSENKDPPSDEDAGV